MRTKLPGNYRPCDDEEFMNPRQLEYFRQKLLHGAPSCRIRQGPCGTSEESLLKPDLTDRASLETERAIELRTRDRERKLISKIDAALSRIDTGTYGFARKPTSRSAFAGSRRARSRRCRSRPRSRHERIAADLTATSETP